MENNFHIAWCPFCNQGWVDIVKDPPNDELFLLCNECDTIWDKPIDIKLCNPNLDKSVNKAETPSTTEVKEVGWDKWLIS